MDEHMRRRISERALKRISDALDLYRQGRISMLVLRVNVERHCSDLRVIGSPVAREVSGFAKELQRIEAESDKPLLAVIDLAKRFRAYRRHALSPRPALRLVPGGEPESTSNADTDLARAEAEVDALVGDFDPIVSPQDLLDVLRGEEEHEAL